jgi:hypothetical protein
MGYGFPLNFPLTNPVKYGNPLCHTSHPRIFIRNSGNTVPYSTMQSMFGWQLIAQSSHSTKGESGEESSHFSHFGVGANAWEKVQKWKVADLKMTQM